MKNKVLVKGFTHLSISLSGFSFPPSLPPFLTLW